MSAHHVGKHCSLSKRKLLNIFSSHSFPTLFRFTLLKIFVSFASYSFMKKQNSSFFLSRKLINFFSGKWNLFAHKGSLAIKRREIQEYRFVWSWWIILNQNLAFHFRWLLSYRFSVLDIQFKTGNCGRRNTGRLTWIRRILNGWSSDLERSA